MNKPSTESGALAALFTKFSTAFPSDNDAFLSRCIYDQVSSVSAECPGMTYEDAVLPNGIAGKWIRPVNATKTKGTILFIHGGGYTFGSLQSHRKLAAHLGAKTQAKAVFMVDYRLAPEHVYPASLDDCLAAYSQLSAEGEPVAIAGDSCGGNLAFNTWFLAREQNLVSPSALVGLSPLTDLTSSGESIHSNVGNDVLQSLPFLHLLSDRYTAGKGEKADPRISALFTPEDALKELPPTWISCAGYDMLRDDGVRLAKRAQAAGAKDVVLRVHDGQQHVFEFMVGKAPEATESIQDIGRWIKDKFEKAS